jgi:2-oxoacid:acceptor oxidoreductase delta subunit (pyruvate/2-ketoisovalerate family)
MGKKCKKAVVLRRRAKAPSLRKRIKGATAVEPGLLKKEALKEARRCLSLRGCEACEVCELLCPDLCITRDEKTGEVLIDLDYCKGCGICASVCPKGAIQMVLEDTTGREEVF